MDIITPRNMGGSEWVNGQPVLKSMTQQLKNVGLYVDDKHIYKTDGLIKLFDLKGQEIILVETSGSFTNDDKNKVNFDHHKGVYGMLSMLKCIADDYNHASLATFVKMKVYFLHAAGNCLVLLCKTPASYLFEFRRAPAFVERVLQRRHLCFVERTEYAHQA